MAHSGVHIYPIVYFIPLYTLIQAIPGKPVKISAVALDEHKHETSGFLQLEIAAMQVCVCVCVCVCVYTCGCTTTMVCTDELQV